MKKICKFIIRKLKNLMEGVSILLQVAIAMILLTTVMALPGVIIAFLTFGNNPDILIGAGILSWMAISVVWMAIDKVKKLVKEYKSFNEEEC